MTAAAVTPLLELRRADVREQALAELAALDARLPLELPSAIDSAPRDGARLRSCDPCQSDTLVAEAHAAGAREVELAVERAAAGAAAWAGRTAQARATGLRAAAARLRERRLALAALVVRECGLPWPDADAEVRAAIDLLQQHARVGAELDPPATPSRPGERTLTRYASRGVVGAITPASSPLAVPAGMTAAALATGNAVVLKPAPQAPACAHALVAALHAAGLPPAALQLLPGDDAAGAALASHPGVDMLGFAGSHTAGHSVLTAAAARRSLAPLAGVLGGVNAVLVDADADLDDAVPAILASAFGRAGQSCASASRLLVHEAVADALRERLVGAIATLAVGPAEAFETDVAAVVDADAKAAAGAAVLAGVACAVLAGAAAVVPGGGHYVVPALFCELPPGSPLVERETPGPLLTFEPVPSVEAACELLDPGPPALVAGLFSRSPATVAAVARRASAGTLSVNRATSDAAAGGRPALLPFVELRTTIERTTRHGLVA